MRHAVACEFGDNDSMKTVVWFLALLALSARGAVPAVTEPNGSSTNTSVLYEKGTKDCPANLKADNARKLVAVGTG